jgi:hypothetical protein
LKYLLDHQDKKVVKPIGKTKNNEKEKIHLTKWREVYDTSNNPVYSIAIITIFRATWNEEYLGKFIVRAQVDAVGRTSIPGCGSI